MSTTLSHGLKKPVDGDSGGTFWDDIADAIQRLNDHNHDGTNSELTTLIATSSAFSTWTASGSSDGLMYHDINLAALKATYTMSGGGNFLVQFTDNNGNPMYLGTAQGSLATIMRVYSNGSDSVVARFF